MLRVLTVFWLMLGVASPSFATTQKMEVEIGGSTQLEVTIDSIFTVSEDVVFEVKTSTPISGLNWNIRKVENQDETGLLIQALADYSIVAQSNVGVTIRMIGKTSGLVHYMQNLVLTVIPKVTLKVAIDSDGIAKWSTPEKIELSRQTQPVFVSVVLERNDSGESIRIHGERGWMKHQERDDSLENVGDSYDQWIDTDQENAKGYYWVHSLEGVYAQRVLTFNTTQ